MAWIESHTVLARHRKLRALANGLRLRPAYVAGHLHLLWHAALEQQEDGDLSTWTDEFIASQADFAGDAPQFVRLLQENGWLDGKLIHDWLDYAGRYLKAKYRTSNPKRLKEIAKLHAANKKGRLKSDFSQTKVSPDNLPNQDNLPTDSQSEADPVHKLATQTGLAATCGPRDWPKLRALVAIDGYETALAGIRIALGKGIGGRGAIAYATTTVAGMKAKRELKPDSKQPRSSVAVREDQ